MGKGSNVQKQQAARERNLKKQGKSEEERKAASDKAKKDASAFMCKICRQTFMVNAKPPVLYLHVTSKHEAGTDPGACFDQLIGYDPNKPDGNKCPVATTPVVARKKTAKKTNDDLDSLLNAGLKPKGKKK